MPDVDAQFRQLVAACVSYAATQLEQDCRLPAAHDADELELRHDIIDGAARDYAKALFKKDSFERVTAARRKERERKERERANVPTAT